MTRTVPSVATEIPGNFITSALWNTQVGGALSFALTPPRAKLYCNTGPSIPSSMTYTIVTFNGANEDSDGGWSSTSNPSQYTIQVAGMYAVIGAAVFNSVSGTDTTPRGVGVFQNGTLLAINATPANTAGQWQGQCMAVAQCAVGDAITLGVMQDSGAARTLPTATNQTPLLTLWWISE